MKRAFVGHLSAIIKGPPKFIQVVLGPRQVGKTTGVLQLKDELNDYEFIFENADAIFSSKSEWLKTCWIEARVHFKKNPKTVLVIDEIQSVPDWSRIIKGLWDEDKKNKSLFHVIILGSSSLELHQGLSESLAGRFETIFVPHWTYQESRELRSDLGLDEFLDFGGYPELILIEDIKRRSNYLINSIVDPVVNKDILQNVTVKKPALFRQAFEIACLHGGEVLSFNKFLGQLQEGGNIDLVKYYLRLYEQAYLIKTLEKFSTSKLQKKGSSPKIIPRAVAFMNVFDQVPRGRKFEVMIGNELIQRYENVYYWREGDKEVDFVLKIKNKIVAIEVKSGKKRDGGGLELFAKNFSCKTLLVTEDNMSNLFELIDAL